MQCRKDFSEKMTQTIGVQRRSSHISDNCREVIDITERNQERHSGKLK